MAGEGKKDIISYLYLKEDEIKNINMLNFIESYPVRSIERIGDSVLMRGESDCAWVYISSPNREDLEGVLPRLTENDRTFAAIEEWMLPALTGGIKLSWELAMTRLVLPKDVAFSRNPSHHIVPLLPQDADYIYEHSTYRSVTGSEFIRGRIQGGPSGGVYESGKPAAWLMTQDDGSIGFLHVLEQNRRKGYAYDLTFYIVERIRASGRIPFLHIEDTNAGSMNLALKLGFRKDRRLRWFKIEPEGARTDSKDYC